MRGSSGVTGVWPMSGRAQVSVGGGMPDTSHVRMASWPSVTTTSVCPLGSITGGSGMTVTMEASRDLQSVVSLVWNINKFSLSNSTVGYTNLLFILYLDLHPFPSWLVYLCCSKWSLFYSSVYKQWCYTGIFDHSYLLLISRPITLSTHMLTTLHYYVHFIWQTFITTGSLNLVRSQTTHDHLTFAINDMDNFNHSNMVINDTHHRYSTAHALHCPVCHTATFSIMYTETTPIQPGFTGEVF